MAFVRPYFMTDPAEAKAASNPEDAAGPVLDAIAAAGVPGVEIDRLAAMTGLDQPFLVRVLSVLHANGLAEVGADQLYRLTDLGAKARYLVAR